MSHKIYIALVTTAFIALAIVFLFFPRSTFSELEKRELAKAPDFSLQKLAENTYTSEVSHWFSDSEPFRDFFMSNSMKLRKAIGLTLGEDNITFHAAAPSTSVPELAADATDEEIKAHEQMLIAEENAKMANNGILVIGEGDNVRALMAFGGSPAGANGFIDVVNKYVKEFPGVRIYTVVVPVATEFYIPERAKNSSRPQKPVLDHIAASLSGARNVDTYKALSAHVDEPIYLRTDHHWSPLGAYYVAKELAATAGVPFRDLSAYDKRVVHKFVGTMYGYSKDPAVKNAPEDFVYYVPTGVSYNTTYNTYILNDKYQVTNETKAIPGAFFYKFNDGSGGAYSTFMGGDSKLTKVKTSTSNGRRALIIKDSYGNAVPGYLFYSFEEIHVVDFRYFTRNLKKYVAANHITDIFFVCNIFNTHGAAMRHNAIKFLTQPDNNFYEETPEEDSTQPTPTQSPDTLKSATLPTLSPTDTIPL